MNFIGFDVEGIGHFKLKESLTIIEETQLENRIDDILEGKYYELKARAENLSVKNVKIAEQIFSQLFIVQMIATLEMLIVEKPFPNPIRNLEGYDTLWKIWEAYKKKVTPAESESPNSSD